MDKLNMSLDQIIKLQKKEKQQMQAKLARAKNTNKGQKNVGQKNIGQKKRTTNVTGKGNYFAYDTSFKQFRGRVGGKKLGAAAAKNNRVSPLNRQRQQGQQQNGKKQVPRKGLRNQNQQLKARQAVNQAKKKLQQKFTQQNQKNQRNQAFNQRRGLPKTQNVGIKQRLGFRKGQGQQRGRINTGSQLRMDTVNRQQQVKKQTTPRRINRQNNQQRQNQQRQITNQTVKPVKKRKWGKTQQNAVSNPILQVSVPNRPTKSVSIQLSPNRQQNPQQRRLSNKVFKVQVAQDRQQRKEGKQQPKRLINNMLAQSERKQQNLQSQVNQLQAVIANIQNTSHVKQNININRTEFARRNTGLSLNQRFSSSSAPQATITQTTFSRGGGRRGRRGRGGRGGGGGRAPQQRTTRQQLQAGGHRMVFL